MNQNLTIEHMIACRYGRDLDATVAAVERQAITLRIPGTHVAMMQALADRFHETRTAFGSELLATALDQAFMLLNAEDRETVCKRADEINDGYCRDADTVYLRAGLGYWETYAYAYARREADKGAAR